MSDKFFPLQLLEGLFCALIQKSSAVELTKGVVLNVTFLSLRRFVLRALFTSALLTATGR